MKISQIAATLGLDEVETIRPIPLTDDVVGPAPPKPRGFDEQGMARRAQQRTERFTRTRRRAGV